MSKFKSAFDQNIERVDSLLYLYSKLKEDEYSDQKNKYKLTDMLRASVVFLHAAFEEYFRNVLNCWLPIKADDEVLKNIGLPGNGGKRPEKFSLSDLASFKDSIVSDLIKLSIKESMDTTSFNSIGDIASWSKKLGLSLVEFNKHSDIEKCIQRRHKIVHEADMNKKDPSSSERQSSIHPDVIVPWKEAYVRIVDIIEQQVSAWEEDNG